MRVASRTGGLAAMCLTVLGLALGPLVGSASGKAGPSAAVRLERTYSPVVALDAQTRACGAGEAYRPTVVGLVLGNREVVLRNARGHVVARAPTARDLSDAPPSDYLDLPGDPLRPGCHYERQFRRWYGERSPSVYAHIATDSEHPDKLAVEYWFYYTFNHFTNLHESDWEMMQVDFDASLPAQALRTGPYEVDLSQHAGGERGRWDDDRKLSKVGTHPVVYVATGSHSTYFQRRLYLGKGGSAIFGCDDTQEATTRLRPRTILLPDTPVARTSPFAWLNFDGRWGQKEASINNGPTGPAAHSQWEHPIAWADGLRQVSVSVPGGRVAGLSVTDFFCGGVTHVSSALIWSQVHPVLFVVIAGLLVALLAVAVRRTSWDLERSRPLRHARSCGEMLRSGFAIYRAQPLTFAGIGLVFIPVSLLAAEVQRLLFTLPAIGGLLALDGGKGGATVLVALLPGGLAGVISAAVVTATVAVTLQQSDAGRRIGAIEAYRLAWRRARALAGATTIQVLLTAVLVFTVVGIPVAIWIFVRSSLFAQAVVLEDDGAQKSRRHSARLTRGRWWRTFAFTALIDVITILSGPIVGVLVLLLTSRSLTFINIIGSIVYALTVPYAAIALTLYYFDLQARPVASLRKPAQTGDRWTEISRRLAIDAARLRRSAQGSANEDGPPPADRRQTRSTRGT